MLLWSRLKCQYNVIEMNSTNQYDIFFSIQSVIFFSSHFSISPFRAPVDENLSIPCSA